MREIRYLSAQTLRGDRGLRLLRHLLQHGADEFSIKVMALADTPAPFADSFEDELGPYELPMARRRVIVDDGRLDRTREVRLWSFTSESLPRLATFLDDGVFHCAAGPDGWLEDLTVYRDGELVLGLVSHQQEGVLRLTTQELDEIAALGIALERSAESIVY